MGYYNYPIAHSYLSFNDIKQKATDTAKGLANDAGKALKDQAANQLADVGSQGLQNVITNKDLDARVKTLTQEAVDTGIERTKQNIFGDIKGVFGALMPYLPFIGVGIVALVALMYFL